MKRTITTTRSFGRTRFSSGRRVSTYVAAHLRRSVISVKQALAGLAASPRFSSALRRPSAPPIPFPPART